MLIRMLLASAAFSALFLTPNLSRADTPQACASQPDQPNTKAEILKIEKEWSQAFWTGHADYLECLYAPDFVSVSSNGKMHDRPHDIAGSLQNVGKSFTPSGKAETVVLMHDGYAIATSVNPSATHGLRYTDIYAYDGHRWHAIFSQDTRF